MAPDGDTTRDRLLTAAREHLDERGLDGLSLRAIARRAGVSHGAPLRHFPGVDHLLAVVAAQGFRDLQSFVSEAAGEAGPEASAVERLTAAGRGYVRFALANPGVFELMFRHECHAAQVDELREAGADAFFQLVELVRDAQEEGWRAEALAAELAGVVWSAVHGVASLWIPGTLPGPVVLAGGRPELEPIVDLMLEVLTGRASVPARSTT